MGRTGYAMAAICILDITQPSLCLFFIYPVIFTFSHHLFPTMKRCKISCCF